MTFQKPDGLTTHMRIHTGEKPFVCEICDQTFTSEKNKRVHVLRHQGGLPHKCDVCNMTFQSRSHLIKHSSSHTRKTQMVSANINSFLENFSASLENDMLSLDDGAFGDPGVVSDDTALAAAAGAVPAGLTDEKALEAAAAEAAFMFGQNDLTDQLLGESGELSSSNSVDLNNITEPADNDPLICRMCQTQLKSKQSYMNHMKKHADERYKCPHCNLSFSGKTRLNRHVKEHMRNGSNTVFSTEVTSATSTTQSVSVETIKCAVCPKSFADYEALQAHTRIHFEVTLVAQNLGPIMSSTFCFFSVFARGASSHHKAIHQETETEKEAQEAQELEKGSEIGPSHVVPLHLQVQSL